MKYNILIIVVVFFVVQGTLGTPNPKPSILRDVTSKISSAVQLAVTTVSKAASTLITKATTTADATVTQTTTSAADSITSTRANNAIDNAVNATNQLRTDSNNAFLSTDAATYLSNTIATANQVVANAAAFETNLVANISQILINIINDAFLNEPLLLDNKIDAMVNAIANVSAILTNSNITTITGTVLTNITNEALATAAKALENESDLTLISTALDTLANVAVLNAVVDQITDLVNTALGIVPVPTDVLIKIQFFLNTTGVNLKDPINDAYAAGVQDLSNITIAITPAINNTVNNIILCLKYRVEELNTIIDELENTKPSITVYTNEAFLKLASIIIKAELSNAFGGISNIIETTAGILSAAKSGFQNIFSYLTGVETTCSSSVSNTNTNQSVDFISPVSTEIAKLRENKEQYNTLIKKYEDEAATDIIKATTVEDTIKVAGNDALTLKTANFRITVSETIQAAKTASIVFPLVLAAVACLD